MTLFGPNQNKIKRSMKEKILPALKNKFKNLGFSDRAFEGVADYLAATVTEEDQIDNAIGGVEGLLKSFQGDIDRRVNEAVAKAKAEKKSTEDQKKVDDQNEPPKHEGSEEVPGWAKTLLETNKKLAEKVNSLEAGKVNESRKQVLERKLEGVPDKIRGRILKDFGRMNFDSDESFQDYLNETETDITELKQDFSNNGLKGFGPPKVGGNGGTNDKKATKEEAQAVIKEIVKN